MRINLKEILLSQGKTQVWLHKKTGISENTISLMVNNASKGIQFDTLEKICEALNVTPNDLIGLEKKEEPLSFGERLIFLREKNNWTRKEVAYSLGITCGSLANYEKNNREPNFETVIKIAELYQVTIDYLLTGEL